MSTEIRPELSQDNKYHISKHRYYELLHFCRQYTDYQLEKERILNSWVRPSLNKSFNPNVQTDHCEKWSIKLLDINEKIALIEETAVDTDKELSGYILMAVTSGLGFDVMKARYDVPCSRNTFYDRYRKFFWILDQRR